MKTPVESRAAPPAGRLADGEALIIQLLAVRADMVRQARAELLAGLHPDQRASGRNLLHYLALRQHDLRPLQEEILWVCEAAHVPAVWATQVLENLARGGFPSRAEVTDAAMGHRAECVMLNKGPHVVDAVQALDDILRRMQAHHTKKSSMLRALRLARAVPDAAPAALPCP